MFASHYFAGHYWARFYWEAGGSAAPVTLELEAAVAAAILADSTLAALIDSCSPGHVPESADLVTSPQVFYRVADWKKGTNLDGADGTGICTLNLAAASRTYSDVTAIAKRLITLFHGFAGSLSGVSIMGAIEANSWDQYNDSKDGTDQGIYTRVVSLHFHHRDPA